MNPPPLRAMTLSPSEIEALHAVQKELLRELARVCGALGLRYQIAAGTLLGAVRHQGFIPWDCDIDVALPRPDFERLLREAPALLDARCFLQHRGSDPAFRKRIATLRRHGSEFRQIGVAHLPMHHGIHIDIFPFDAVRGAGWLGHLHLWGAWLLRLGHRVANDPAQGRIGPGHPRWRRVGARAGYLLARLTPAGARGRLYDAWLGTWGAAPPSHVACLVSLPLQWRRARRLARPLEEFLPTRPLLFEGHAFPAPAAYDAVLTRLYGDYRELPPPALRVPRHIVTRFRPPADTAS
ncbi:LicD family protein [Pigmentiphaga humi]|uniref:LicD family protein n=1 Tax=Pigmentiphaga humi TaxID=2478468 RepID=A0A3P4B359_9BURK|nr:LicD family protein [Pigmentiphaga humi]VCU70724.1 LicD family protein [Pigmentiphaga humi]